MTENDADPNRVDPSTGDSQSPPAGLISFLRENKRWWLIPVVVAVALFTTVLVLSRTAAAPFVYTLF